MILVDNKEMTRAPGDAKFITSAPAQPEWAQPTAICYSFSISQGGLYGTLVCRPVAVVQPAPMTPELAAGFQRWETASNEAALAAELKAWEAASDELDEDFPA